MQSRKTSRNKYLEYKDQVSSFLYGHVWTLKGYDEKGKLMFTDTEHNLITNAGLNSILDVYLKSASQITTWYIGLIDNASCSAIAAADTMASHAGWIEIGNGGGADEYDETVRQTWTGGSVSGQSVDNTASPAVFTFNETKTVKGAFCVSDNTKGGTSGTLLSLAAFDANRSMVNTQTLSVTFTASASSA